MSEMVQIVKSMAKEIPEKIETLSSELEELRVQNNELLDRERGSSHPEKVVEVKKSATLAPTRIPFHPKKTTDPGDDD